MVARCNALFAHRRTENNCRTCVTSTYACLVVVVTVVMFCFACLCIHVRFWYCPKGRYIVESVISLKAADDITYFANSISA